MKFDRDYTAAEIAGIIGARVIGNPGHVVSGINEIHKVEKGDLSFVDHPKYYKKALESAATTILINIETEIPRGKVLIFSEDPFRDYNRLVQHFRPFKFSSDLVSPEAKIGEGTVIQPGVYIGADVQIGSNCLIHPNVTIYSGSVIGNRVEIHSGAIIGADAFYYQRRNGKLEKMKSCGRVIIEDDVEIGAACTIDKGVSGDTVIGMGTKFDNQVHIGHDTVVGRNCIFAAQVGVAGVTTIEDDVILWGQVGVSKDLVIGKGAVVLAQSGVAKSLEGGATYFGSPAAPARERLKEMANMKKVPEIIEKIGGLK